MGTDKSRTLSGPICVISSEIKADLREWILYNERYFADILFAKVQVWFLFLQAQQNES